MRPDEHKAKASKRWKAKHGIPPRGPQKDEGGARRGETPAGIADQISNTNVDSNQIVETEERPRSKYARRKIESNAYRYHEPTPAEVLAADEGFDRETEELRRLIRDAEETYDSSVYFQFREEKELLGDVEADGRGEMDEVYGGLLQINFEALETSLKRLPLHVRLSLDEKEILSPPNDSNVDVKVSTASRHGPKSNPQNPSVQTISIETNKAVTIEPPIVQIPALNIARPDVPEKRINNGPLQSSRASSFLPPIKLQLTPQIPCEPAHVPPTTCDDDLDMLLNLDQPAEAVPPVPQPASHENRTATLPSSSAEAEDLKWLDDILG
ncbi:uncharacterized protein SPPG_03735 [Spizellomyces punctatus DAOM BR117]|uniref:Uncharacterized protein n=1 Tax=Spizellomyces punctatus (strain DAOM BR117) TaxID=645134 RepID=A0A0L0HHQ5_SPIPD|nr:uncharacterized protein SPPG_03735 [Spizellomyces punctatus DAOM BR117]KND00608.1 hypothetical protein SPPG_03735 [Spizellomyces punctatus DAOM BR117]|eukprot:XP_016608647.1 hypothetical protein SPPG_03735 [Spizellomyces punctatus DAOM BR117]